MHRNYRPVHTAPISGTFPVMADANLASRCDSVIAIVEPPAIHIYRSNRARNTGRVGPCSRCTPPPPYEFAAQIPPPYEATTDSQNQSAWAATTLRMEQRRLQRVRPSCRCIQAGHIHIQRADHVHSSPAQRSGNAHAPPPFWPDSPARNPIPNPQAQNFFRLGEGNANEVDIEAQVESQNESQTAQAPKVRFVRWMPLAGAALVGLLIVGCIVGLCLSH